MNRCFEIHNGTLALGGRYININYIFGIEHLTDRMETPKGKLFAIGGAEDKGTDLETGVIHRNNLNFFELGILRRIVAEVGSTDKRIEVITTATSIPKEVGENYKDAFAKVGYENLGLISVRDRSETNNPDYLKRLSIADAVMFTGGNQLRLTSIYGGTDFLKILHQRYLTDEGFMIAGTSAGAMAMSNTMIYEGNSSLAHMKGAVKITTGLGFISTVIFDSHFDKRGRFGRLAQAVSANPSCIGVGLGEDTGVLVTEGNKLEAVGSGPVIIIDGHNVGHSNIADLPEGTPFSIEGLQVHFMAHGNHFNLDQRHFEVGSGMFAPQT